jgi:sugar phosphate isomerase/epimerase
LQSNLDACIDYAKRLQLEYMICPAPTTADRGRLKAVLSAFPANTGEKAAGQAVQEAFAKFTESLTIADWRWNAEFFNTVGQRVKNAGMRFGYHNHNVEFRQFSGTYAYDELLRLTDPELVTMELDCGWMTQAGLDPKTYLAAHPGRFRLLHVKDVKQGYERGIYPRPQSTEVGRGVIDWARIFAAADSSGVQHFIVEQEPPFSTSPMDAVRKSYEFLQRL